MSAISNSIDVDFGFGHFGVREQNWLQNVLDTW